MNSATAGVLQRLQLGLGQHPGHQLGVVVDAEGLLAAVLEPPRHLLRLGLLRELEPLGEERQAAPRGAVRDELRNAERLRVVMDHRLHEGDVHGGVRRRLEVLQLLLGERLALLAGRARLHDHGPRRGRRSTSCRLLPPELPRQTPARSPREAERAGLRGARDAPHLSRVAPLFYRCTERGTTNGEGNSGTCGFDAHKRAGWHGFALVSVLVALAGILTASAAAQLPSTTDPRFTLTPGFQNAGEASWNATKIGHADKAPGLRRPGEPGQLRLPELRPRPPGRLRVRRELQRDPDLRRLRSDEPDRADEHRLPGRAG